ncbi:GNAT family N-acetyltransferase [Ruegeria pomeroyi]|uniref:Acetyltransferase, GNAT family n=2 Tax=Ruegeria pomeroyi TaxID=89184 RepID=Q5LUT7_RUEPO|nr:GNAT family N-acetyltransferase [Ruegeria pomeroyi]AAV94270.1 acetyltransferase, GNAT family [Ruegeria pomeroyi DSS-3]NVK97584.1 GNAT family N-acetyltransferase [Ruegeria pomeroyi]NVL01405.1 GNAT family N-acetyltransferase [Ruegeria pomeroyi]QWV07842.1 GNAT family N-acetyltransferase [Ruegeria pomeroyi]
MSAVDLLLTRLEGEYAITRRPSAAPLPGWQEGPGLISVTRAPDETSILCLSERVPEGETTARGWQALRVETLAALDQPGVVLAAVEPVSRSGLGVFVTSTHDRDYLLVRAGQAARAEAAWIAAGHNVCEGGVTLRRAGPQDAEALATLHFQVWQETYARIAPPEVRLALNKVRRTAYWRDRLASGDDTVIALRDGVAVGLAALSPSGVEEFDGCTELDHLYIAASARRSGLGARLLGLARAQAALAGAPRLILAVVRDNAPARAFYQAQGGAVLAERQDKGPLWRSDNLIFGWATA